MEEAGGEGAGVEAGRQRTSEARAGVLAVGWTIREGPRWFRTQLPAGLSGYEWTEEIQDDS